MFGTLEVSARSDPIGGITLRAQMSWWGSEARLWKFRTFCDWDVLCCRSTWLTAQTETDSKRQAWWAGSYIFSVTHLDYRIDFGFNMSNLRVFPSLTPECVCYLPEVDRVAGGRIACQRAIIDLCQQTGPDDGGSCVWAGRNSRSEHHPGSYVGGPGLLRCHCRGAAGTNCTAACAGELRTDKMQEFMLFL